MGALGRPCGGNDRRDQPDPSETKKISRIQPDHLVRLDGFGRGGAYENSCDRVPDAALPGDIRMEWFLIFAGGPRGLLGPILLILVGLWLGRGNRSPWYVKAALLGLLTVLFLIMFGYI